MGSLYNRDAMAQQTSAVPDTDPSMAVIEAVAGVRGEDPVDLPETLSSAVDPDALDRLFSDTSDGIRTGRVSFTYCGCDVTVHADGRVEVTE